MQPFFTSGFRGTVSLNDSPDGGEVGVMASNSAFAHRSPCLRFSLRRVCKLPLLLFLTSLVAALPAFPADVTGIVANAQGGEPLAKIQLAILGTSLTAV